MIIDTNVLVSTIDAEAADHDTCLNLMFDLSEAGSFHANEVIFAELSGRFDSAGALEAALDSLGVKIARLSLAECHRAGQAFREYRRRKGTRTSILPDFLIGAQAELRGWPILTKDRKGFESYFPNVALINPNKASND